MCPCRLFYSYNKSYFFPGKMGKWTALIFVYKTNGVGPRSRCLEVAKNACVCFYSLVRFNRKYVTHKKVSFKNYFLARQFGQNYALFSAFIFPEFLAKNGGKNSRWTRRKNGKKTNFSRCQYFLNNISKKARITSYCVVLNSQKKNTFWKK